MTKTLNRVASAAAVSALAGTGTVLAAAPAQAADYPIWDKVAYCESTNNWSINTGNGFYGGLQFTISTWNAFGGQQFADRADHATKAEQILVARRVLGVQGPGAWPLCSKYAGLTRDNGGAIYNWQSSSEAPATTTTKTVTTTQAVAAVSTRSTTSTVTETKAEESAPVKKAVVKKAVVKKAVKKAAKVVEQKATTYEVKAGDSLFQIAQAHGIEDWHTIYELNKDQIDDPDLIYIGQHFILEEA